MMLDFFLELEKCYEKNKKMTYICDCTTYYFIYFTFLVAWPVLVDDFHNYLVE